MAEANGLAPDLSSYSNPSTNKLLATAGNSPQAASDWLTVGRQQQQLTQDQLLTGQKTLAALNGVLGGIIADPSLNNATARIADAVKAGVIRPEDATQALQQIASFPAANGPNGQPDGNAPNEHIRRLGIQHIGMNADIHDQLGLGGAAAPQLVNTGGSLVPMTPQSGINPSMNRAGGGSLPMSQDPNSLGDMVDVVLRDGSHAMMTKAQAQRLAGYSGAPGYNGPTSVDYNRAATAGVSIGPNGPIYGAPPPAPPGTQPGDVTKPGPVGGSGQYGRGPTTAGAGVVTAPQGGAPQPQVPGIPGPPPMLAPGREDYRADLTNSTAKMTAMQPLLRALPLIEKLGAQGSGPGTQAWNEAKSALVSLGVIPADATDVATRQEAAKYLSSYIRNSPVAGRSDMAQQLSQASSPNLETSNAATLALTRSAIAMDRMEAARPFAYGSDDLSGYSKFRAGYPQSQDVRAYGLDVMPADQRLALLRDMSAKRNTPEGKRFWQSLQTATDAKMMIPPGAPATAGAAGGQ